MRIALGEEPTEDVSSGKERGWGRLRARVTGNWPLLALLVVYLVVAVGYSLASPLYEPTDEIRHFRYVRHILEYRSLPVQQAEGPRAQSHHPPLYYALGALVSAWVPVVQDPYYEPPTNPHWGYRYWEVSNDNKNQYLHREEQRFPFRDAALAVYVVRTSTILLGALAVGLVYHTGRLVFAESQVLPLGAAALVAFNPQFLYLSGAVGNDVPATLCSAAVLLVCLRMMRMGTGLRTDFALGALFGLALLTKLNLAALYLLIALAYLLSARPRQDRRFDWRAFIRGNLIVVGCAVLIAGWWFWRNQALYGDPTGMSKVGELWSGRDPAESWWALKQSLPYLWSSFWGRFGYGQVPMHQAAYAGALVLCGVALVGHVLRGRRRAPGAVLFFLGIACLIFLVVVSYYILIQPAGAMGRFLFPALPAFGLLIVLGLRRFLPNRLGWVSGITVTLLMLGLALYALVAILHPAFARPRPLNGTQLATVPNALEVDLGGVGTLLGYKVSSTVVSPGDVVDVTLYWRAEARTERDHAVFVHLLSDVGTIVAQRDTFPGLGRYPTTAWDPGVAFADTYRVHVPGTAYAPDSATIQVGMYLPGGPRLLAPDGRDAIRLTTIEISEVAGDLPNPMHVNFDNRIALIGYSLARRVARPGGTVRLTLYWQSLSKMDLDYSVFSHVLGAENRIWARSDGWPADGRAPTTGWEVGQVIEDVRDLTLDVATPPYLYDIEVGIYEPGASPLPVVAEDGHWLDQRVVLCQIRVADD